jgi:hypothetical protein
MTTAETACQGGRMNLKLKSGLAALAIAAAAVIASNTTANASIMVEHVKVWNAQDSSILGGPACIVDDPNAGSRVDSCNNDYAWYNLESVYPDAPGHAYANVRIRSTDHNECLTVLNEVGPGGFGNEVSPRPCNGSGAQEWASTRSANGSLNYYNFQYRECLDGGYWDTYGFPKTGCIAGGENEFEDWAYYSN